MKYFVRVGARELMVDVDGDRVTVDGNAVVAELLSTVGSPVVRLRLDGRTFELAVAGRGPNGWHVIEGGTVHEIEAIDERTRHIRSLGGARNAGMTGGVVKAPMPGKVVRLLVALGDPVVAGQGLVVLEAMKMENELKAPGAGVVQSIGAIPGAVVEKGSVLVELAPAT